MDVGMNIRRIRRAKDITQKTLSQLSDISQSSISEIESGKRDCSLKALERIASALGCQAADLLAQKEA